MLTTGRETVRVPPLGLVTVQTIPVNSQPPGTVSATLYVVKVMMLLKNFVFEDEILGSTSTRLKYDNGEGDAVKGNEVSPSGVGLLDDRYRRQVDDRLGAEAAVGVPNVEATVRGHIEQLRILMW